ncbi:MAG: hypothetical protein Q9217_005449 [Psora testacea]
MQIQFRFIGNIVAALGLIAQLAGTSPAKPLSDLEVSAIEQQKLNTTPSAHNATTAPGTNGREAYIIPNTHLTLLIQTYPDIRLQKRDIITVLFEAEYRAGLSKHTPSEKVEVPWTVRLPGNNVGFHIAAHQPSTLTWGDVVHAVQGLRQYVNSRRQWYGLDANLIGVGRGDIAMLYLHLTDRN